MTNIKPADIRVAIATGGAASEREISLSSAAYVKQSLLKAGFAAADEIDMAEASALHDIAEGGYDVVFIAMHGKGGEDGTIQGALEYLGVPYTGSGVAASACAADKDISKVMYAHAGIPLAPGVVLERGCGYDVDEIMAVTGERCFVKPALNGSSYGVTPVTSAADLPAVIEKTFEMDEKVLVEKWIEGTEVTAGVLGNEDAQALPVVEIATGDAEFYDLKVKYEPAELHHVIPARLSDEDYRKVQKYAVAAHHALGCAGFSRSDFIVSPEDGPVIIETNNIPGMTETSLFPDAARHMGMDFSEVCVRLIELAFERFERRG